MVCVPGVRAECSADTIVFLHTQYIWICCNIYIYSYIFHISLCIFLSYSADASVFSRTQYIYMCCYNSIYKFIVYVKIHWRRRIVLLEHSEHVRTLWTCSKTRNLFERVVAERRHAVRTCSWCSSIKSGRSNTYSGCSNMFSVFENVQGPGDTTLERFRFSMSSIYCV